jgi:hypothetical protein
VSAKNLYHDAVVHALQADGWTITDDPLRLSYGGRDLYVDLAAERGAIAAEREGRKIAVEVQSFLGKSPVRDLEEAVGQYEIYRMLLADSEPDRRIYMAIPQRIYESLVAERFGQFVVSRLNLWLLVFDATEEKIIQWIE